MKKVLLSILLISGLVITTIAQPCLPDGITFTTQSQIDSFPINYPNCTEVEGDLIVYGSWSDIVNLDSLYSIESVGGGLVITRIEDLLNLSGLDNLVEVGEGLEISRNDYLISLSALQSLVSIGGDLVIKNNYNLPSLSGLENIEEESIANLVIYYNTSLSNCQALNLCDYLSDPNGMVRILLNDSGCFDPPDMAASCGINLPCLPFGEYTLWYQHQIDSFNVDYPGCYHLDGVVNIGQYVSDLGGLSNIESINGSLYIQYCHILTDLIGLDNLIHIEDSLLIYDNEYLLDLNGLNGLSSINGGVMIGKNDVMESLSGLDSLMTIDGNLSIEGNDYLNSLNGIDNIESGTIENLSIVDNERLTECNVQSICDYLVAPNGTVTIYDNLDGCNSRQEVEDACTVTVPEIPDDVMLSAYPNPFTTTTTIEYELTQPTYIHLTIYNAIGETIYKAEDRLMPVGKHSFTWSPESLPEGLYYGVLRSEEGVSVVKMIKQ